MKRIFTAGIATILSLSAVFPLAVEAYSYSYYQAPYTTSYNDTATQGRLQVLLAQIQALQAELARIQSGHAYQTMVAPQYTANYQMPVSNYCNGGQYYGSSCYGDGRSLQNVRVTFEKNFARVRIQYGNGAIVNRIYAANTQDEVIQFLMSETGRIQNEIASVTSFNDNGYRNGNRYYSNNDYGYGRNNTNYNSDNIDSIRVRISSGDAHVTVNYQSNSDDTFTLKNETSHADIISNIADRLDLNESDVRDLVTFSNGSSNNSNAHDVRDIAVTIYAGNQDTRAKVRYDDGTTETFYYSDDTKSDIVTDLADELDMSESDVRDVIAYSYN